MQVTHCEELVAAEASADEKAVRTYKRQWRATVDDGDMDAPAIIATAPNIPRRGQAWVGRDGTIDWFSRCNSVNAVRESRTSRFRWIITATWTTAPPDWLLRMESNANNMPSGLGPFKNGNGQIGNYDAGNRPENPIDRPCRVALGPEVLRVNPKFLKWDRYDDGTGQMVVQGATLQNSAREQFTNLHDVDVFGWRLTVTRSELKPDFTNKLSKFSGVTNDSSWCGFDANKWLCHAPTFESDYQQGINFWRVTYSFSLVPEELQDWDMRLLDEGYSEWSVVQNATVEIWDRGAKIKMPRPLNGAGLQLGPDGIPVWRRYRRQGKQRNFDDLGLT